VNGALSADVRALIDRCRQAGIQVALDDDGQVHVTWPDTPEAESLLAELRRHRDAVAALLAALPRPGGHLVRLGLALGLLPRCRFTVREQSAPEAAQRFAQAVADLCRRHRGSEAVLMVAVEPDGERVPILWRAAVGAGLRRELAELVRDYHLGLGPFGVWRVDDVSGPDEPPPAQSPAAVQAALPLDGGRR
jgi:hypothetical protein